MTLDEFIASLSFIIMVRPHKFEKKFGCHHTHSRNAAGRCMCNVATIRRGIYDSSIVQESYHKYFSDLYPCVYIRFACCKYPLHVYEYRICSSVSKRSSTLS